MSDHQQKTLRRNVNLLGTLLGDTIRDHKGQAFFEKIESIRQLSKEARKGAGHEPSRRGQASDRAHDELLELLRGLSDDELVPVVRAFSHFLNLANIAEQFNSVSRECEETFCVPDHFKDLLKNLKSRGLSDQEIADSLSKLRLEVVLTAHPTEVTRRTLIQKYEQVFQCLSELENESLTVREKRRVENRIRQLISQAWHTYEFRSQRPSPIDEAKGGFATLENSLWYAVPQFARTLDERLEEQTGLRLPIDAVPVRFSSWMGGDRDGNPYVTARITREVLLLSRWMAADLYLRDLRQLIGELSMSECSDQLRETVGDCREPYRAVLKKLRERLRQTRSWCEQALVGSANGCRSSA